MNRVGVTFQKIRTLTSVDPLTGKSTWTRLDLDQGLELFGDEQYVFAVQRTDRDAYMLDAIDGRMIGRRSVPPARTRASPFAPARRATAPSNDSGASYRMCGVWLLGVVERFSRASYLNAATR